MIRDIIYHIGDENFVIDSHKINDKLGFCEIKCDNDNKFDSVETDSKGIFTTLVRIKGSKYNVVPVKSSKPLDKKLWIECSKALSRLYVGSPIKAGDMVCKNILNTGADIVCTKNID